MMTALELNARKAEMIRLILNDMNSEAAVVELESTIHRLTARPPCRYTPEEIRASAEEAIRQRRQGGYTPHEEIKRMFDGL